MNELPHLTTLFDRLKRGYHLGPDDEPEFSVLCARFDEYASYFAAIGLVLVRHEREFFYFEPENPETVPETLPRIAVFSYIIIDYAANQGPADGGIHLWPELSGRGVAAFHSGPLYCVAPAGGSP